MTRKTQRATDPRSSKKEKRKKKIKIEKKNKINLTYILGIPDR